MRPVSNERLSMLIKRRKVLRSPALVEDLGPADVVEVSPLRSFAGSHYYQFSDGSRERIVVVASDSATTYATLIQPRLSVAAITPDELRLRVETAPHCTLTSVGLVFGQPAVFLLGTREVTGEHAFTFEGADTPIRGTRLRALVQAQVDAHTFTTEVAVPYRDITHLLSPYGLAALNLNGVLRIFNAGDPPSTARRIIVGLEEGVLARRIVEPIAVIETDEAFAVSRIDDTQVGILGTGGHRYLIASRTPGEVEQIDNPTARAMAAALSWRPFTQRKQQRGPGGDAVRRFASALPAPVRSTLLRTALRTLGYDNYHRLRNSIPTPIRNAQQQYIQRLPRARVSPRTVLHVGFHYTEFSGHLVQLAMEFAALRPEWEQTVVVQDPAAAERTCLRLGIPMRVVTPDSREYGLALLTAEVLATDSTLPRWFTPREGQRVFNLWHGTPMKSMGRAIGGSPRAMSNTQRNFLLSTGVLLSNQHTVDALVRDYMVPPDNVTLMPSPRNTWLFQADLRQAIRRHLGIADEELVVLYVPTWRGEGNSMRDVEENVALFHRVARVRARITRPVRFFAKPHRFTLGQIDPAELGLLTPPDDLDLYEFLSAVDCLVTDYSSILFDFLVCNRPIILDTHDHEQYAATRGFLLDPASVGLPLAPDEDSLVAAIESAPERVDHSALITTYCPLDGPDGTRRVLERILGTAARPIPRTDRERVAIFPGALWTNGITTSFLNLLANLDTDSREYWVLLPQAQTSRPGPGVMEAIAASEVSYLPTPAGFVVRRSERDLYHRFNARLPLDDRDLLRLDDMMLREADRVLPGLHFDHVVHFSGYEAFIAKFLGALTLRGTKLHMWVHNDMRRELELRNNFNEQILMEAYHRATTIDVVSEPVAARLLATYFPDEVKQRVRVVHNTADSARVRAMARAEVDYMTPRLASILNDPSIVKFINIGRFSPEKDHARLVEAFEIASRSVPDRQTALFLVGGPGNSRDALYGRVATSQFSDRIWLFEGINPHPILSGCDLFVLSSHYEGLPMVFFEALALDVPILSTAIPGPKEFLERGYGATCEDSTEGLAAGMRDFMAGRLAAPTRSLDDFNRQAVEEFEAIFG